MTTKPKVAFFDTKPYDRLSFERFMNDYPVDIHFYHPHLSEETVALTQGFDAVCVFVNDSVSREVTEQLCNNGVRLIALRCAGYNNVELESVYGKIHVVRVPEYSPYAVAEHTVALLLALNRKTHKAYSRTRDSNFSINGLLGFDLHGKTAGIIGTGKIGRVTIGILRGFGMKVLAFDPYPNEKAAQELGYTHVDLAQLYAESDIISLHCPLTPENMYMINRKSIAQMKEGVFILNTGRGKLINTSDLIEGLKSQKIGAAGLDVYEEETDYFFEDFSGEVLTDDVLARLLTFPNVLVTSHQAFFTREALNNIANTTLTNITSYFEKGELAHEVCYRCGKGECIRQKTGKCF
ncbi:MAG: 2-hydroxyacid dehydrogenase [Chitinivibrionales bacterium]